MASINKGPSKVTVNGMTSQPRSFMDFLAGRETVKYNRPSKAKAPTQKSVTKNFKSYGPTSNGIGVGM